MRKSIDCSNMNSLISNTTRKSNILNMKKSSFNNKNNINNISINNNEY